MSVPRYIRNGQVAVLVSPGFGGGWSTWGHGWKEELALHRDIVKYFLGEVSGSLVGIIADACGVEEGDSLFPYYAGGENNVSVRWVDIGTRFEIREYDGAERIYTLEEMDILEA